VQNYAFSAGSCSSAPAFAKKLRRGVPAGKIILYILSVGFIESNGSEASFCQHIQAHDSNEANPPWPAKLLSEEGWLSRSYRGATNHRCANLILCIELRSWLSNIPSMNLDLFLALASGIAQPTGSSNIIYEAAVASSSAPYHMSLLDFFISSVLCSGWFGLFGWLVVAGTAASALVVIIRHFWVKDCHNQGTYFYAIAHLGFLIFSCVSIDNLLLGCTFATADTGIFLINFGQAMLMTAIGLLIFLILTGLVYFVTKVKPQPSVISIAGLTAVLVSYLIIFSGIMLIAA